MHGAKVLEIADAAGEEDDIAHRHVRLIQPMIGRGRRRGRGVGRPNRGRGKQANTRDGG